MLAKLRAVTVLIAGWVVLTAQTPSVHAPRKHGTTAASPAPQPTAITPPAEVLEARRLAMPCARGDDRRNSDLCAQWKAADAAADAARWAMWSFWLSLAGTLGLFITLYYTRRAVRIADASTKDAERMMAISEQSAIAAAENARAANEAARLAAEANQDARAAMALQTRAWVIVENVRFPKVYSDTEGRICVSVIADLRNTGDSPAIQLSHIASIFYLFGDPSERGKRFVEEAASMRKSGTAIGGALGPGETIQIVQNVTVQPHALVKKAREGGPERYHFLAMVGGIYKTVDAGDDRLFLKSFVLTNVDADGFPADGSPFSITRVNYVPFGAAMT